MTTESHMQTSSSQDLLRPTEGSRPQPSQPEPLTQPVNRRNSMSLAYIMNTPSGNTNGDMSTLTGTNAMPQLPEQEKEIEKTSGYARLESRRTYPSSSPIKNMKQPRNAKKEAEVERCALIAKLMLEGKEGDDLLRAVQAAEAGKRNMESSAGFVGQAPGPGQQDVAADIGQRQYHAQPAQHSSQRVHPYMAMDSITFRRR